MCMNVNMNMSMNGNMNMKVNKNMNTKLNINMNMKIHMDMEMCTDNGMDMDDCRSNELGCNYAKVTITVYPDIVIVSFPNVTKARNSLQSRFQLLTELPNATIFRPEVEAYEMMTTLKCKQF